MQGEIKLFGIPTPNAGPDGTLATRFGSSID
jgi:hypothetical protein